MAKGQVMIVGLITTLILFLGFLITLLGPRSAIAITFEPIQNLSDDPTGSHFSGVSAHKGLSQLAASGTNVYVVWVDGPSPNILFRRSTDEGINWESPQSLATGGIKPVVVANGATVFVIWDQGGRGNFRRSTDGGRTFEPAQDFGRVLLDSYKMVVKGSNVDLVWTGGRLSLPLGLGIAARRTVERPGTLLLTSLLGFSLLEEMLTSLLAGLAFISFGQVRRWAWGGH